MSKEQFYFVTLLLLLTSIPLVLHSLRRKITLGPFFGLAGIYSILLWQMLQTGWWISFGSLQFNAGLTTFVPAILMGALLTFALDGLRTARSYFSMVLIACIAAWLFALFRERLAHYVPLPYLVVLSSREHLAITAGLLLAQIVGKVAYILIQKWHIVPRLPLALLTSIMVWLWVYSLLNYGMSMGVQNVLNEQISFLLTALPAMLMLMVYGIIASRLGMIMPPRSLGLLLTFWRSASSDDNEHGDELTNRDRVLSEVGLLNRAQETSTQLMEYHMTHAAYGIVITDQAGKIRRHNGPAAKLFGDDQLSGKPMTALMRRLLGQAWKLDDLTRGSLGRRWRVAEGADGGRWLEVIVTPLKEGDFASKITGYYFLLKDDTAAVREETRKLASSRIRDLNETGKVLMHDFSNLLMGAEAQLRSLENKLPESADIMQAVSHTLNQARTMLKQLGAGSQFGSPLMKTERAFELVSRAAEICKGAAADALVTITLPHADHGWEIEADRSQMIRVLTNLISNAIRACAPGSNIMVGIGRRGAGVEITVTDNGSGMSTSELELAFEPGFSTKGEGKGGLGLAISYLMVDAHGGHLTLIHNPSGRGICATVWLPEIQVPRLHFLAGKSVIVASEIPESIMTIINELESGLRCSVAEAHNEDEVLALLLESDLSWDAVLLDHGMDQLRVRLAVPPEIQLITMNFEAPDEVS